MGAPPFFYIRSISSLCDYKVTFVKMKVTILSQKLFYDILAIDVMSFDKILL